MSSFSRRSPRKLGKMILLDKTVVSSNWEAAVVKSGLLWYVLVTVLFAAILLGRECVVGLVWVGGLVSGLTEK